MRFLPPLGVALMAIAAMAAPALAEDDVKIGLEIPLSPPGDPAAGQLIRRGAELAIDYVNSHGGVLGGRKVALAVEDDQGRTEAGIAGFRRLASEEHVVGVTGAFHSSVAIAENEVAKELGVPTLATQASAADITAKHYDIAFRTHAIDPIRVETFIEFIKKQKLKRISVVAETTDFGIGISDELDQQNDDGKLGLELQKITFDHATTDLTPQLLQVKAFKPELVLNIAVGQPLDLMIDQATTLGILPQTPMLVSYDAPSRPQYWQLHPKNGVGLYFIAYYSPRETLSPEGSWLVKAYEEKYREPPIYSSLNGFGDVLILAQAVDQAKSADPQAVTKALASGKFKSWAAAPVTFPEGKGVYWHNWSPPILVLHYTKPNEDWRAADVVLQHVKTTEK